MLVEMAVLAPGFAALRSHPLPRAREYAGGLGEHLVQGLAAEVVAVPRIVAEEAAVRNFAVEFAASGLT